MIANASLSNVAVDAPVSRDVSTKGPFSRTQVYIVAILFEGWKIPLTSLVHMSRYILFVHRITL